MQLPHNRATTPIVSEKAGRLSARRGGGLILSFSPPPPPGWLLKTVRVDDPKITLVRPCPQSFGRGGGARVGACAAIQRGGGEPLRLSSMHARPAPPGTGRPRQPNAGASGVPVRLSMALHLFLAVVLVLCMKCKNQSMANDIETMGLSHGLS